MTTGVRPALLREDWHWAGPPASRKLRDLLSVDATVAGLLRDLGNGGDALADAKVIAPNGGGLYDLLFFENAPAAQRRLDALAADGVATDSIAGIFARRVWALERALGARGHNPTYFRNPSVLLGDQRRVDGKAFASVASGELPADGAELLALGDDMDGDTGAVGILMLAAAVVDSLVDDVAFALGEPWDRAAVWNLVFPGTTPRGAERPTYR